MSSEVNNDRAARAAEDAKAAEQKQNKKATDEQAAEFKRMLGKQAQDRADAGGQRKAANQQAADTKRANQNSLWAKQGIRSQQFEAALQQSSVNKGDTQKTETEKQTKQYGEHEERVSERDTDMRDDRIDAQKQQKKDEKIAQDDQARQGQSDGSMFGGQSGMGGGNNGSGQQPQGQDQALAALGGLQGGAGAAASHGAAGASGSPAQMAAIQLANALAEKFAAGFTADGLATAHISLQEGVLSGAHVQVTRDKDGKLDITLTTDNPNVGRLVDSLGSRQELLRQLDGKDLQLASLKVKVA